MAKPKAVKPKFRYVSQVVTETAEPVTKKALRETIEAAMIGFSIRSRDDNRWVEQKTRVRSVDID
ncbi:MAG: hypothetical protein Q8R92_06295 [Deltaproteobacteria bacterium]|nr:hypothetical protein [Deltaproteobacteria bacterium]